VSDVVLGEARAAIDEADRELLAVVNRRLEVVRTLHEHKQTAGLPLRDPGREAAMIAGLQEANAGPLSAEGVDSLFRFVLDLIRKEIHGEP
jgi:chorismate mutase / prephenate dehydratase